MKTNKKIILCFIGYYLPDYNSGGPVRSIENFVNQLSCEFDIKIVCNNHDSLKKTVFEGVFNDTWQKVGNASVYYVSKKTLKLKEIKKLINDTKHDILYVNSFFSYHFSLIPIILSSFKNLSDVPCIIAPRGEFSSGAIKIKFLKKKLYLIIFKLLGLHKSVFWQATSDLEKKDIKREIGNIVKNIHIAPNLTLPIDNINLKNIRRRKQGKLRIIFLSRISPKKNLDFILKELIKIKVPLEFAIYGPKSDLKYWKRCLNLINKLPSNVQIIVNEEIPNNQVQNIFENYDLFVFPTLGENFGHVIFECLKTGTPVLVSDQTPWKSNEIGGLQTLSLNESQWTDAITEWSKFDDDKLFETRKEALEYISNYTNNSIALEQNKKLFNSILNNKNII
ncbi:glycosyltransferase family 4 protein [Pelagibacterales bacterium SAG-MED22]|nr:glycosyltransferase family 4 protein [Pelagibacterales bacterium SAG-MED22]